MIAGGEDKVASATQVTPKDTEVIIAVSGPLVGDGVATPTLEARYHLIEGDGGDIYIKGSVEHTHRHFPEHALNYTGIMAGPSMRVTLWDVNSHQKISVQAGYQVGAAFTDKEGVKAKIRPEGGIVLTTDTNGIAMVCDITVGLDIFKGRQDAMMLLGAGLAF